MRNFKISLGSLSGSSPDIPTHLKPPNYCLDESRIDYQELLPAKEEETDRSCKAALIQRQRLPLLTQTINHIFRATLRAWVAPATLLLILLSISLHFLGLYQHASGTLLVEVTARALKEASISTKTVAIVIFAESCVPQARGRHKFISVQAILLTSTSWKMTSNAQNQTQTPFPKFFGGIKDHTDFDSIDYHSATSQLVVGGGTRDSGIAYSQALSSPFFIPIILRYQGASFAYSWGIYDPTVSQNRVFSVSISSDGSTILAQLLSGKILVLSATAGTLTKAIMPSFSFSYVGNPYKSLGMNSGGKILFTGKQIALFGLSSTFFGWSIANSAVATIGLVFGNPDTFYAANFAKASTNCFLTLMRLSDGSIFYQNYFQCSPIVGYLAEKVISGSQFLFALADESSSQKLTMTVVDSTQSVTSASYYSLTSSGFKSRGLSIASETIVYSIVSGTINSNSKQIGLEVIDLQANQATLTQVLPQYNYFVAAGVFTSGTTFFATQTDDKFSRFQNQLSYLSPKYQGILLTSDQTMTSQTLWANPTPQIISFTPNSAVLTVSPTALIFSASSSLTITTSQGILCYFNPIATNTPPIFSSPLTSQSVPICQSSNYTFPSIVDPNTCQTFTIAAVDSTLTQPSYLTAVSTTGMQIRATSNNQVGTQSISVSLSDGMNTTRSSMQIEITNSAPVFEISLINQTVQICSTLVYYLPAIVEPNSCQNVTTTFTPSFSFATYNSQLNTLTFNPTSNGDVRSNLINVTLSDGASTSSDSFYINIINTPPKFGQTQSNKTVQICFSITQFLGPIVDDNSCQTVLSSIVNSGPLSPYIYHNPVTHQFSVSTNISTPVATQTVQLNISDGIEQDSTSFQVTVLNIPPSFQTPLLSQQYEQNKVYFYILPTIQDPNTCQIFTISAVETGKTTLPVFMSFTDMTKTVIKITPKTAFDLGWFSITVSISDGIDSTDETFFIQVLQSSTVAPEERMNTGPPVFKSDLLDQTVVPNSFLVYQLPDITDPDGDKWKVAINLGAALQFTTFFPSNNSLMFNASKTNEKRTPYSIKITLTDDGQIPQSTKYVLSVSVKGVSEDNKNQTAQSKTSRNESIVSSPSSPTVQEASVEKNTSIKTLPCILNLLAVSTESELTLKIVCQSQDISKILALQITNQTLGLTLQSRRKVPIQFHFLEQSESSSILKLKMDMAPLNLVPGTVIPRVQHIIESRSPYCDVAKLVGV